MTKNKTSIQKVNRAVFRKTVTTGFCGGVLWSTIWLIMHYFNMIKISPTLIWEKLFSGSIEFNRWYMYLFLILLYGIFSVFLAILYYLCFKTIGHWAMGAAYGLIIWIIAV